MNPDNLIVVITEPVYLFDLTVNQMDVDVSVTEYSAQSTVLDYTIIQDSVDYPVTVDNLVWQITPSEVITVGGGTEFPIHIGNTPPENPEIGDLWLDTN